MITEENNDKTYWVTDMDGTFCFLSDNKKSSFPKFLTT